MKYTTTGAGSFSTAYVASISLPFDLRLAQSNIADLLSSEKFRAPNGRGDYRYEGMVVSVTDEDTKDYNNGLYVLVDESNRNNLAGWLKLNSSSATISQWEHATVDASGNVPRVLLKGEIALGYKNGVLEEVRVGNGTNTWNDTNTFIPAFLTSQKTGNRVFGLDNNSKPTLVAINNIKTTVQKRTNESEGQNDGLFLSHDTNTNTYTIGIENSGWEITCN